MKHRLILLPLLLLVGTATAHAELYKWVGPDGKVSYSDTAPPSSVKQVEKKSIGSGGANTADLPYELTLAVKNNPVTLYTTAKCPACEEGRKLLGNRGIPFSEKTVATNEDIAHLRQLSGEAQLPVLTIGRNKERGFETGAWNAALTAAGYPASSQLPKNYNNGKMEAAAPVAKTIEKPANAEATAPNNAAPASTSGTAPAGFRF